MAVPAPDPNRPNLLLITTDQQRFDTVGPRKPAFLRTPHLDFLGRQGVSFSSAYTPCPHCVPARTSIMTGQDPYTHGMTANAPTHAYIDRSRSLPSRIARLGYTTAAIGKMHFGPQRTRHGFEEMILPDDYYREMRHSGNPLQPMRHGLQQCSRYPTLATVPEALTLTSWTAERTLDHILFRRDPTVPFFIWTSFAKPHPPFDPPEPYYSLYRDAPIPEPVHGDWAADGACPPAFELTRKMWDSDRLPPDLVRATRAAYYGLITQIDYNLGRVFAALQETGQWDNTLVLFCSDHGDYMGDHGMMSKLFFHEPSAHVPFILRLPRTWDPKRRREGSTCDLPVSLIDILPTLVATAGGRADDVDGIDLLTALDTPDAHRGRLIECTHGTNAVNQPPTFAGITDGRWKYTYWVAGAREELFDLQHDPNELHNLAADPRHDAKRAELRATLLQRHLARGTRLVADGALRASPAPRIDETSVRASTWLGCATEYCDDDIRH